MQNARFSLRTYTCVHFTGNYYRGIFLRAPGGTFPRNDSPGDEKYASRLAYFSPWGLPGNFLGNISSSSRQNPAAAVAGRNPSFSRNSGFPPVPFLKFPILIYATREKAAFPASAHSVLSFAKTAAKYSNIAVCTPESS